MPSGPATNTKLLPGLVRVIILALPILLIFAVTVSLVAGVVSWFRDTMLTSPENLWLGILCALVVWLFVAIFHLKRDTMQMACPLRQPFIANVRALLEELGYESVMTSQDQLLFTPSFQSLLFGGGIHVTFDADTARITGPKMYVEMLRNRIRLRSHVENLQKAIQEQRDRKGDRILKRVQISLRVPMAQWQGVREQVIDALIGKGAEVLCDVNILAHCEAGIQENVVEQDIRDWLSKQDLKAEIHKEPLDPSAAR